MILDFLENLTINHCTLPLATSSTAFHVRFWRVNGRVGLAASVSKPGLEARTDRLPTLDGASRWFSSVSEASTVEMSSNWLPSLAEATSTAELVSASDWFGLLMTVNSESDTE
jgi:hypothetical protein